MPTPPTTSLRVTHAAEGWARDARAWGLAFERAFAPDAPGPGPEPLKVCASGDVTVWAAALQVEGRAIDAVLKVQPSGSRFDAVRARLGMSRHHRQRRGADRLDHAGIGTAACIAILSSPACETLVMPALPGRTLLEWLASDEITRGPAPDAGLSWPGVLRALSAYIDALGAAGLVNADGKPSNLVMSGEDAVPTLTVVDTVAIRTSRDPDADRVQMYADLLKEPIALGVAPSRPERLRALLAFEPGLRGDRAARRARWRAVAEAVGDPGALRLADRLPRVEHAGSARPGDVAVAAG